MNSRFLNTNSLYKKTNYGSSNFLKDKTVSKQSKFNFIDSEDDCSIVEKGSESRLSSSVKFQDTVNNTQVNRQSTNCNVDKPVQTSGIYKTAEDKYKLLDILDKCYNINVDTVALNGPNLAGTCQDMCPEKERYYKEFSNNISIFEKDENNKFNHQKAVKMYERCAADHRLPHPYELRPTEVLDLTMNYLIRNIFDVDFSKISWEQWYYFLWTRTRSILKDITQQNLCNSTVVKIIETMVRFYIFSSARFCEESKDFFNKKYNDTNLKNCIHSLKDLYKDMPKNICRNEAEFRGYMIILNIENKSSLHEVQELSNEVLKSNEVQFALQVYEAFKVHNYVRFFRLLKNADFITSCLLHRFIVQARLDALTIINKAYVVNKSGENQVPLGYFFKIFGFDNMVQTREFFKEIGFTFTNDNNSPAIILNGSIMPTNNEDYIKRSLKLVENKQANEKLSAFLSRDNEIYCEYELPLCKMISFNYKDRYIGTLKFPSVNFDNMNKECPKNNDLQCSDLNIAKASVENELFHKRLTIIDPNSKSLHPTYTSLIQNKNIVSNLALFQNTVPMYTLRNHENDDSSNKTIFSESFISRSYNQNLFTPSSAHSQSSNQVSDSIKVSFYIPQYKSSVSCESSQSDDSCNMVTEDENKFIDIVINDLLEESTKELCTKYVKMEQFKNLEFERIFSDIIGEIINTIVIDTAHSIIKSCRKNISIEFANDIIDEVSEEICQALKELLKKKKLSIDKYILNLKKKYFNTFRTFTTTQIKDRKSMINLPATPRNIDDFTICEEFRGKVRKICTDKLNCSDDYWLRHPVMARLDQVTMLNEYLPRKAAKKNIMVQTDISYADIKIVQVNVFIRQFIEAKFIKVLDSQLNILELVQQTDPSPDKIISDYNDLIDQIDAIVNTSENVDIIKVMKLPLICLDVLPLTNWMNYIDEVFKHLSISDNYKNTLFEDINWTLKQLKINKELPELSYYHLRLFPWVKILKCAVMNKLMLNDYYFGHLKVEVNLNIITSSRYRLQLENTINNLSISKCLNEANLHMQKYVKYSINSPNIQNSRRLSAYYDLVKKLAELEKNIDECKE